jgi:ribosomal protein S18 acetylase RimI-like enzyme
MQASGIRFGLDEAALNDVRALLHECDEEFPIPLSTKVNIEEYARKIHEHATNFEAWKDETLVGVISTYFNDKLGKEAFITNVCVVTLVKELGIASELLRMTIAYGRERRYQKIRLEVDKQNVAAMRLYTKFGFTIESETDKVLVLNLSL